MATLGFVGAMLIETSVAGVTVSTVVPYIPVEGSVAVMVAAPAATDVANPFVPEALLMVAVPLADELHVAKAVRSCVVVSEKMPVAVN